MPFRKKAVARKFQAVHGAIVYTVKIYLILANDRSELFKIEVSVPSLYGLEGPLDALNSLRQSPLTLRPLTACSQAKALVFRPDASHMRIERPLAPQECR